MIARHVIATVLIGITSATHLDDVLVGCSEICNINITGVSSKFFPFIKKKVDCSGLWSNTAIDASRPPHYVHQTIPPGVIISDVLQPFLSSPSQHLLITSPTTVRSKSIHIAEEH
jgi:hypothetical protein